MDYNDGLESLFPDDAFSSKSDRPISDPGFDSDFGPKPVSKLTPIPSSSGTTDEFSSVNEIEDRVPGDYANQSGRFTTLRDSHGGCRAVNTTHFRDTFDSAYFLLPEWHPSYDFDAMTTIPLGRGPEPLDLQDEANPTEAPGVRQSPPNIPNSMSIIDGSCSSRPSSSSSKISSFLSEMSLSSFPALDGQISPALSSSFSMLSLEIESPIILPGAFPEYCWQHLNKNRLLPCGGSEEGQTCYTKHYRTSKPTYRSLRADIFSRIVQRTIRPKDIHEVDTFGNSIIHISATLLAPPSYLISLIEMGANVNSLNNAGQTFLHLIKPETLEHCNDFCQLLEILMIRGFNFGQHDPLGQTPLHLLLRPWIRSDILTQLSHNWTLSFFIDKFRQVEIALASLL
jgi:hypothetical protein